MPVTHGLTTAEWNELRTRRKAIDGNACVFDGSRGTDGQGKGLHVDHIIPYPWGPNHVDNLRTLCERHHSALGYRRTVNPFYVLDMFEIDEAAAVDRDLDRGFGVLRG